MTKPPSLRANGRISSPASGPNTAPLLLNRGRGRTSSGFFYPSEAQNHPTLETFDRFYVVQNALRSGNGG